MNPENERKLVEAISAIQTTLVDHGKKLDSVMYSLDGNGKPGLKTVVSNHDAMLKTIKRLTWVVLTPVIASVVGGIIAGSVYLIKLIP